MCDKKKYTFLDKIVFIVTLFFPLTTIPQILKIWLYKNAQGISIITWFLFILCTIPLLLHCIIRKDKALTVMFSLWIVVYLIVIVGTAIYG
ncbi:MAG: hypothetical protein GY710_15490 [Desulfobacteraceae bacterium]|nr:hypothetical protein [Desulfobacteraceae bacterium]